MKVFNHLLALVSIISCSQTTQEKKQLPYDVNLLDTATKLNFAFTEKRGIKSKSGVVYIVTDSSKTLTAYLADSVLWKANVLKDDIEKRVVGIPEIRYLELGRDEMFVVYGKHCFANVNLKTGKISYEGCD